MPHCTATSRLSAIVRCRQKYIDERQGAWNLAGAFENKNTKFFSEALGPFMRKFARTKISHYNYGICSHMLWLRVQYVRTLWHRQKLYFYLQRFDELLTKVS